MGACGRRSQSIELRSSDTLEGPCVSNVWGLWDSQSFASNVHMAFKRTVYSVEILHEPTQKHYNVGSTMHGASHT